MTALPLRCRTLVALALALALSGAGGCGDGDDDGLAAAVGPLVRGAATGLLLAGSLGGPAGPEINALGQVESSLTLAQVQARVEQAYAKLVRDASCQQGSWSGQDGTLINLGCTLVLSGESLDEVLSLRLTRGSTRVAASSTYLKVGGRIVDGSVKVAMALGGAFLLTADLGYTPAPDGAVRVTLQGLQARYTPGGTLTLDGVGEVRVGATATVVQLRSLILQKGRCQPVGGTLSWGPEASTTTATFSAASASAGTVNVAGGSATATALQLLTPCP